MCKYKMELSDALLGFKLPDKACLHMKDRQLACTACTDLTFTPMKSALKRIFGREPSASSSVESNQEITWETQRRQRGKSWPQKDQQKTPLPGTNPLHMYGPRSKCATCQSTFHWTKDWQHKGEQVKLTEAVAKIHQKSATSLCTIKSHSLKQKYSWQSVLV